jgi:hypothetical protein
VHSSESNAMLGNTKLKQTTAWRHCGVQLHRAAVGLQTESGIDAKTPRSWTTSDLEDAGTFGTIRGGLSWRVT